MPNEVVSMAKWKRRRAGRKRKAAERHDCGKIVQPSGPDQGTVEQHTRRKAETGSAELSPDYPLQILHGRRFLVPSGFIDGKSVSPEDALEESHQLVTAGMAYAARYWRLFGKPFGKGLNYERFMVPRTDGEDAPQTLTDPAGALRDERQYEAEREVLHKAGALKLVNAYCVRLERDWFIHDIAMGVPRRPRHIARRDLLLKGLRALAAAPRAHPTDKEAAKAEQEAA